LPLLRLGDDSNGYQPSVSAGWTLSSLCRNLTDHDDPAPTPAPQVQTLRRPGPHTRDKAAVPDGSGRGWRAAAYTDRTERPFAVGDGDESSMWTPLNYGSASLN
jgi:hypothetical protein